jgi:cytosine/adenosine deaminase-related metal-dependent hydrolase
MADSPIHVLRRFLDVARPTQVTDAELLHRYAANRDESAFAELVRRHGPMVLGTAARVIGADPCTEDAFQATFLALARRARWVRGIVVVEQNRIVAVGSQGDVRNPADATEIDAYDGYVSPGFVDIHTHGGEQRLRGLRGRLILAQGRTLGDPYVAKDKSAPIPRGFE